MKKRKYFILAAAMLCLCFVYSVAVGGRYVMDVDIRGYSDKADRLQVKVEQDAEIGRDTEIIRVTDSHSDGDHFYITLESVSPGRVFVLRSVYVHRLGIITEDNYFGKSTGSWCFPIAITIFLGVLIIGLFMHIKKEMKRDLYQYKNVRNIGFALFLTGLFVEQLLLLTQINRGLIDSVELLLGSAGFW